MMGRTTKVYGMSERERATRVYGIMRGRAMRVHGFMRGRGACRSMAQ